MWLIIVVCNVYFYGLLQRGLAADSVQPGGLPITGTVQQIPQGVGPQQYQRAKK